MRVAKSRHRYFGDQLDGMARELSKLAIACDIKMFEPGMTPWPMLADASSALWYRRTGHWAAAGNCEKVTASSMQTL